MEGIRKLESFSLPDLKKYYYEKYRKRAPLNLIKSKMIQLIIASRLAELEGRQLDKHDINAIVQSHLVERVSGGKPANNDREIPDAVEAEVALELSRRMNRIESAASAVSSSEPMIKDRREIDESDDDLAALDAQLNALSISQPRAARAAIAARAARAGISDAIEVSSDSEDIPLIRLRRPSFRPEVAARAAPSAARAVYDDEDNQGGLGLSIAIPLSPGRAHSSPGRAHSSPGRASHSSPGRASHSSPGRASHSSPGRASHSSPGRASHSSPGRASHSSPGRASHSSPSIASQIVGPSIAPNSIPGEVEQYGVFNLISNLTDNPSNNPNQKLNRLRELLEDNTISLKNDSYRQFQISMGRLAKLYESMNRHDLVNIINNIQRKQYLVYSLLQQGITFDIINKVVPFLNFNDSHFTKERLLMNALELIQNLSQLEPGSYGRKSQRKLKLKSQAKLKLKSQAKLKLKSQAKLKRKSQAKLKLK